MQESNPFKWRHYQAAIILLCVRWYLRYALSFRELEEMMVERGLTADHSTIARWVLALGCISASCAVSGSKTAFIGQLRL